MTIKASPDVVEPYLLLVPLFNDASANGHMETVTDHTGKPILYLKFWSIPQGEYEREETRSRFSTIIDVLGLDGTAKGQVATDVTVGCYARSRLANSSDSHWATIKSAKKRGQDKLGVDDVFSFKVVPTFSDVHIGAIVASKMRKTTHAHVPVKHDTRAFGVTAMRGEDSERPKQIGKITIGGNLLHLVARTPTRHAHTIFKHAYTQTHAHANSLTHIHMHMFIHVHI